MSVYVRNLQRVLPVDRRLLSKQAECIRDAFENGKYRNHEATIILTTNARIRKLNERYGTSRQTTDVLSFRLADRPARRQDELDHAALIQKLQEYQFLDPTTGEFCEPSKAAGDIAPDLGTIFMAVPYCDRIAQKRDMSLQDYLLLCCVHGMAHLAGYDHANPDQYNAMREAEKLGMAAVVDTGLAEGVLRTYLP